MNRRKFIKSGALWVAAGGVIPARSAVVLKGNATLKGTSIFNQQAAVGAGPTVAPVFLAGSAFVGVTLVGAVLTVTGTVPAGTDRLMLISICQGNTGGVAKGIVSVFWNTVEAASAITGFSKTDGNFCSLDGYYLVNPTVATGVNLVVTFASTPSIAAVLMSVYTGAAQSGTIFGTAVTGSASNTTSTVNVTTGTGQINWAGCSTDANSALTVGGTSSPTERKQTSPAVSGDMEMAIGECGGTGTFQWTWAGADNGWAMCSVPVNGSV